MLTNAQFRLPDTPPLSGKPEEQIATLTKHIDEIKRSLSQWFIGLNAPGGLSVVRSGVWTPAATSGTGTITLSVATGRYWKLQDDIYFYYIEVTIATAGTGAGACNVTLPFTVTDDGVGVGADVSVTFKGATITIGANSNSASILGADGLTLIADGAILRCMGFWICED